MSHLQRLRGCRGGDSVSVTLDEVVNPSTPSSTDTVSVITSSDTTPATSGFYSVLTGAQISQPTVTNGSPSAAAGARTVYTVAFATSASTGGLAGAAGSTISITFPAGANLGVMFNSIVTDTTSAGRQVGGDCAASGLTETCSIFNGSTVGAGDSVSVAIGGVTNPSTVSSTDTVSVSTSSDAGSVTSAQYSIGGPPPPPPPPVSSKAPALTPGPPSVTGTTSAALSGGVTPNGLATSADFAYGLDARYRGQGASGIVYDQSTPAQQVGSDFALHPVSALVTGLLPNAEYHVRLVAVNTAGTVTGPDQTFTTPARAPPPPPVLGKSVDVKPVSGVVFIKPPPGKSLSLSDGPLARASVAKGPAFIPLTEARQLPTGTQVDARQGSLQLIAASTSHGKTQVGVFGGGLFAIAQDRSRLSKGLTTLSLLEGAFPGAPSYARCKAHHVRDRPAAQAASLSPQILQTLRARDNRGHFRTRGRYSAATVRGTVWDTIDRCDGTLTVVHRGTVLVTDFARRVTVSVHAGHSYLAKAGARHQ
jgi:hypothetical protein